MSEKGVCGDKSRYQIAAPEGREARTEGLKGVRGQKRGQQRRGKVKLYREKSRNDADDDDDDIETKNEVDGKRRTKLSGKDREI